MRREDAPDKGLIGSPLLTWGGRAPVRRASWASPLQPRGSAFPVSPHEGLETLPKGQDLLPLGHPTRKMWVSKGGSIGSPVGILGWIAPWPGSGDWALRLSLQPAQEKRRASAILRPTRGHRPFSSEPTHLNPLHGSGEGNPRGRRHFCQAQRVFRTLPGHASQEWPASDALLQRKVRGMTSTHAASLCPRQRRDRLPMGRY